MSARMICLHAHVCERTPKTAFSKILKFDSTSRSVHVSVDRFYGNALIFDKLHLLVSTYLLLTRHTGKE